MQVLQTGLKYNTTVQQPPNHEGTLLLGNKEREGEKKKRKRKRRQACLV